MFWNEREGIEHQWRAGARAGERHLGQPSDVRGLAGQPRNRLSERIARCGFGDLGHQRSIGRCEAKDPRSLNTFYLKPGENP